MLSEIMQQHEFGKHQIHSETKINMFGLHNKYIYLTRQIYLFHQTNIFISPDKSGDLKSLA